MVAAFILRTRTDKLICHMLQAGMTRATVIKRGSIDKGTPNGRPGDETGSVIGPIAVYLLEPI